MTTIVSRPHWIIGGLLCAALTAQAQVPANPFDYTRTSGYSYLPNGKLEIVTVEPNNALSCSKSVFTYDTYGNPGTVATSNCTGAPGESLFTSRSTRSDFLAAPTQSITVGSATATVAVQAGLFATLATNQLGRTETRQFDPRFGAITQISDDANGLLTRWVFDDFGRPIKELRPDNTKAVIWHCLLAVQPGGQSIDTSSNSVIDGVACPSPQTGEAPADAVAFVHREQRDASSAAGSKMGAFVRIYLDRLGRVVRNVTEGFDGPNQPAGLAGQLVVTDSVYSNEGTKLFETQPYFLATKASITSGSNSVGVTRFTYDAFGRATYVDKADASGAGSVSFGTYGSQKAARTSYKYDGLRVITTNDKAQTRTEEHTALGGVARVTDASGAQIAYLYDAFGNLLSTRDALQNSISTVYDILGRRLRLNDPDKGIWLYCYDAIGQLKAQQSPTLRASNTVGACPTSTGVGTAATGVARWTTYAYDRLGRSTQRLEREYASTWTYDKYVDGSACSKGVGKLCETSTNHGVNRKFAFDALGRPSSSRTSVTAGPTLARSVAYDVQTGRVSGETYPTGIQVGYTYTPRGYAQSMVLKTTATVTPLPDDSGVTAAGTTLVPGTAAAVLWQAQAVNAWGKVETNRLGNAVVDTEVYAAATGRTVGITAGVGTSTSVMSQRYGWDSLGNLSSRIDDLGDGNGSGAVSETFIYGDNADNTRNINRLTKYSVSSARIPGFARTVDLQYNALGQMLFKSDVGNYTYGASGAGAVRPHTLRSVRGAITADYTADANGNVTQASGGKYRKLTYTSFDMPDGQDGISGAGTSPLYQWQYDENHQRIKETRIAGGATRVLWYAHPDNVGGLGFEREENTSPAGNSNRHFLTVNGEVVGVLVSTSALPSLAAGQTAPPALSSVNLVKVEYWHKDHLGSLSATTDHTGKLTARYSYDPFGKRRFSSGAYDAQGSIVVDWNSQRNAGTARGFTGHEGLDDIGLVNMNGRIFDPTLGLFVQPDPNIKDPFNLQNFNRYAYVLNNPLNATDPSGFDDEAVDVAVANTGDTVRNDGSAGPNGQVDAQHPGKATDAKVPDTVSSPPKSTVGEVTLQTVVINAQMELMAVHREYSRRVDSESGGGHSPAWWGGQAKSYKQLIDRAVAAHSALGQSYPVSLIAMVNAHARATTFAGDTISKADFELVAVILLSNGIVVGPVPKATTTAKGVTNPEIEKGVFPLVGPLTQRGVGELIGWGKKGAPDAIARTESLTAQDVAAMQRGGINKSVANDIRDFYANEALRNANNPTAAARADLMSKVISMMK